VLSTVQIHVEAAAEEYGKLLIGGCNSKSITKSVNFSLTEDLAGFHIINIGQLIEKNENNLRIEINDVYINK